MKRIVISPLNSPIKATVSIPGSKSYTNRALLLASLVKNSVVIRNSLQSNDTDAMISCLKTLGISVETHKDFITVSGSFDFSREEFDLNAHLSGTTIRFVLALACTIPGIKIIHGIDGLNKRPIGDLVTALQNLGATIEYQEKNGYPPLKILSSQLTQHETEIEGSTSSQFTSALLMIGPRIGGLTLHIAGEHISKSYIDITLDIMKQFGIIVKNDTYKTYTVPSSEQYKCHEYTVEGDYSSASYFAAIAALTKSQITLKNMNPNSVQGDKEFLTILEQMGNVITYERNSITIQGIGIKPVTVDMKNCPDQAQTLAVLTAFANGTTHITGISSLRVKETERIKAVEQELFKMGIKTESTHDSLTIYGGIPKPAEIDTYGDHRMAMAFAVAGTKVEGIKINNPEVVEKTFPDFWKELSSIGVTTYEQ